MNKLRVWRMVGAVVVVVLQILMCNRIALWGVATPVSYTHLTLPTIQSV